RRSLEGRHRGELMPPPPPPGSTSRSEAAQAPPSTEPFVGACRETGWSVQGPYRRHMFSQKVRGMLPKGYMSRRLDRACESSDRSPNCSRWLYECAAQNDGRVRYVAAR